MLDAKLDEELTEYHKDQNIEELADLLEVLQTCAVARGYTLEQLEAVRAQKALDRGGFDRRIMLTAVENPSLSIPLARRIAENQGEILAKIDPPMLQKYYWLMGNLHCRNVATDMEYRKKFSGYYRMRFVSNEYRDAFFSTFERIKGQKDASFEDVARELFEVDEKHEFSFISKMLHTINDSRPIYDSQVHRALGLHRPYAGVG